MEKIMSNYFHNLHKETKNRFWINNPSLDEIKKAINHGAIACTTNPSYCSRLIEVESNYLDQIIDNILDITTDIEEVASLTYQKCCQRIMDFFLPIYEENGQLEGYVTVQSDPRFDEDELSTIKAINSNRLLGKNFMAKIPVINGGIEAIEYCVKQNIPICATEVFAISQAETIYEIYDRASKISGNTPPLFITHISGIFDEYLKKIAKRNNISVDENLIDEAGLFIARKQYQLFKSKGYNATILGGGARNTNHFTGLVGGPVHITINWSTAKEIIDSNTQIVNLLESEPKSNKVEELRQKFPDFRRAYDNDGLLPGEYADFGPVQLFRNSFLRGWYLLLAKVAQRRHFRAL
jgi:transaldolase